nr:hypothetical protein [Tanacetum cinerariifolium]
MVEKINKLEKQIIEGKLTLMDDDGKSLPKVVSTKNADSDSEVEDVVDDHVVFMASTGLKRGDDSEYGIVCVEYGMWFFESKGECGWESMGCPMAEKVTVFSNNNNGTHDGNVDMSTATPVEGNVTDSHTDPNKSDPSFSGTTSYAKLVNEKPSRKSVNFHALLALAGNGADVAISLESVQAISERFANTDYGFFLGKRVAYPVVDKYVRNTWSKFVLVKSMLKSFNGLFFFKFSSKDVKNLKNPRQAVRGVQVRPKMRFKPVKQAYRPVNNASTSGKKKLVAVSSKEVSNSNPFDALNSIENNDSLGMNGENSKSVGKGPNSGVSPSNHGFFNVISSSTSTTPMVEKINKLEKQIIEGKLTLVDDDGKPLPKVVSTENADSDSEVEDVVDDHVVFMASTGLKRGDDSEYCTNSLLEQLRTTK